MRPWTTPNERERRLAISEIHSLVERARAIHNPLVRHGFYAGLTALLGRQEMELVRHYVNHREVGGSDIFAVFGALTAGVRQTGCWLRAIGGALDDTPHDPRSAG